MNSVEGFNSELLSSLRSEHEETEIPIADLAFDRLCGTLESEGEIEAIERLEFTGSSSGKPCGSMAQAATQETQMAS